MKQEVLRLEDVTYKKGNTIVFRNMMLNIMSGEIMGLIPINSYGLEELLDVIVNNPPLYYGYVYYQEQCVNSWKEEKHSRNRICLIGSETSLVNGLSVLTNIFTLRAGFGKELLNENLLAEQLKPFLEEIHISLDPFMSVEKLSAYERVLVELLRAIVAGYHLIIFQEISTAISENELEKLYEIMRFYAKKGFSFLYVSFHFEEIQQICTRAALMIDSNISLIFEEEQIHKGISKELYIDYYNHVSHRLRHRVNSSGRKVLNVRDMSGRYLDHFHFQVFQGECLVIQSLDTKLYIELLEILEKENGLSRAVMFVDGKRVNGYDSRRIAFLKEEPSQTMLFEHLSVRDNLCIALDGKIPSIWMRKKVQKSVREEYTRIFGEDIFDRSIQELTEEQKTRVVYARILLEKPDVVFMVQPFKHAGTPYRLQVWEMLTLLLEKGISIVILAMNMSDSLTIADRIIRISRVNGKMAVKELNYKQFGKLPQSLPWVEFFDELESKKEEK